MKIIAIGLIAALLLNTASVMAQTPAILEDAVVTDVIDGDTIAVTVNGAPFKLRYIGIDAPEKGQPKLAAQCYAAEATAANRALVSGQTLKLERDKSNTDRYQRLLRYAYLPDGRMVNEVLVQGGAAFAKRYKPDVKYADRFAQAQVVAQTSGTGLWAGCKVVSGRTQPLPLVVAQPIAVQAVVPTAVAVVATATPVQAVAPAASNCDPSYPTLCIPIGAPDIDCPDIAARRFPVLPPDPHRFDADHDGIGCERG